MRRREWTLPGELGSVTLARAELRAQLVAWDCAEEIAEDASLVLTELVGNAVRHGCGRVEVSAALGRSALRLGVSDEDAAPIGPRAAAPDRAGNGRGLAIVAALSRRWGVEHSPTGKRVWSVIGDDDDLEPPGDAATVRTPRMASADVRHLDAARRGRLPRLRAALGGRGHGAAGGRARGGWPGGLGAGA